jgi:hypothetical protein
MTDRPNLSTEHQPKGAAKDQSATLDKNDTNDSRDVTAESRAKQEQASDDAEHQEMEDAQKEAAEDREENGGYQ